MLGRRRKPRKSSRRPSLRTPAHRSRRVFLQCVCVPAPASVCSLHFRVLLMRALRMCCRCAVPLMRCRCAADVLLTLRSNSGGGQRRAHGALPVAAGHGGADAPAGQLRADPAALRMPRRARRPRNPHCFWANWFGVVNHGFRLPNARTEDGKAAGTCYLGSHQSSRVDNSVCAVAFSSVFGQPLETCGFQAARARKMASKGGPDEFEKAAE